MLLLASIYFYSSNNGWQLFLLLGFTQVDFLCGLRIEASVSPSVRKWWLALSVGSNLAVLGFFKYSNCVTESLQDLARFAGQDLRWQPWHVALPVGISFDTFQTMSDTIDVYRGHIPAERS